jgi:hypothetical protein
MSMFFRRNNLHDNTTQGAIAMSTPQITIETITPEQAKAMLDASEFENRPLRSNVARIYAQDMQEGRWQLTGEPIVMNGTSVINGQHRLTACTLANVPFTTAVMRNAEASVYEVIDSGFKRTVGDVLRSEGHANSRLVAAIANVVLLYQADSMSGGGSTQATVATRHAILEEANSHRNDYRIGHLVGNAGRDVGINCTGLGAFVILLDRYLDDMEEAERFSRSIISGVDLKEGDPRLALRRWVISARRVTGHHHLAVLIRCWNAYNKGERRVQIKGWDRGQPFPKFGL